MSLATQISLRVTSERLLAQDLQTARALTDALFSLVLASGVGAGQADNVFSDELVILTGATQDLDFAGGGLVRELFKHRAHVGMGILRLGGGRRLSRSDGPNRLIGDHCFQELLGANPSQAAAQLSFQHLLFSAGFPLFERFPDTQNRL